MPRPLPLLLAALALTLCGCRYNFVPLFPPVAQVTLPARLTTATLARGGQTLTLTAALDGRFDPGYLSVRWYDGSRALGEDSVYLDGSQRQATFTLTAPQKGAYRAVLSFGGVVMRQVELYEVAP